MSRVASVLERVSATLSRASSFNFAVPWDGVSNFLLGHNVFSRRGRRRRNGRRSRGNSRSQQQNANVIPPPHSYAIRRQEGGSQSGTASGTSRSVSTTTNVISAVDGGLGSTYRSFNRSHGHNSFAYSILGSPSGGSHHFEKDKNVFAAFFSILVIATLATALAQPKWFSINGGSCSKKYIGLQEFLYMTAASGEDDVNMNHASVSAGGKIHDTLPFRDDGRNSTSSIVSVTDGGTITEISANESSLLSAAVTNISKSTELHGVLSSVGLQEQSPKLAAQENWPVLMSTSAYHKQQLDELRQCVTPDVISLQRMLIALCFVAIVANLVQFFLDTLGTSSKCLNSLRVHAVGNVLGVIFVIGIVGLSYLVTSMLEQDQQRTQSLEDPPKHVEVRFEISYYLATLAGLIGLIAAACNLLRRPSHYHHHHYYLHNSNPFNSPEYDASTTTPLDDDQLLQSVWTHSTSNHLETLVNVMPPPPYAP